MTKTLKDFDDLLTIGQVKRTVKVGKHLIMLSTVTSEDYNKAMDGVPDDAPSSKKMEIVQRELVATAIREIDGESLSHEEKVRILSMGQLALSNLLYNEYIELVEEQGKLLEDAKKNSSPEQMP